MNKCSKCNNESSGNAVFESSGIEHCYKQRADMIEEFGK